VLTNIENGRRETVTLAEWLVLAAALRVPPLLLVFPVGRVDVVEPLPGFEVDPLTALHWAETGQLPAPAPCLPERPADEDARLIERYRRHRELVSAWRMASGSADAVRRHWSGDERDAELARLEREQRVTVGALRDLRDLLRSQGLILPELSPAALRESVAEDEKRIES
jgi:hypothetical protein